MIAGVGMLGAHTRRLADSFGASRKINRLTRVQNVTEQRREREREGFCSPCSWDARPNSDGCAGMPSMLLCRWMNGDRTNMFIYWMPLPFDTSRTRCAVCFTHFGPIKSNNRRELFIYSYVWSMANAGTGYRPPQSSTKKIEYCNCNLRHRKW